MPIYGPLGFGKEAIAHDVLTEVADAQIDVAWKVDASEDIVDLSRTTLPVVVVKKGFRVNRRSLAASRTYGTPLDTANAKSAAYKVAKKEDELILDGYAADGSTYDIKGLYQKAGNSDTGSSFGTSGQGIDSLNAAMALLLADNIYPPYHMVLNPTQYMEMHNELSSTAVLEIDVLRRMLGGGEVFVTPAQTAGTGMVLAAGDRGYFDLAVGVDITTEVEVLPLNKGRDLYGIVYECVVPRVWETNAICKMTAI
jgi:uncharacterized linocin/CFP29 family protein